MSSIQYRRIVDLSQEISPDLQVFPAYPKPVFIPWTTRERHGFLSEALFMVSHSGTHVDAPSHYRPEGKPLHKLPLSRFLVPCRLLDLRPKLARSRIGPASLRKALRGVPLARGSAVILWTGWETKRGRQAYLHENPGLTRGGAEELLSWSASVVGIDTANIDLPEASDFPAHHTLLKASVPILENVAHLAEVRAPSFTLAAFPLSLRGATGSPIRAVALV